ncbi:hypothetical protein BU24DRAFT_17123 [Aaosphaeria arxii CBS 175.79]|uniref:Uncharacterized protein n=1 Tax=Aaosphaeria arxii CBS 175.79 TaxID=1450172 RepID=A0A6A5Y7E8_9PLEO|nr:uncharacterized protein BU24DRAFT_17123 [Aaosphaeria arxii CBS 175.79]KAF2021219.1 hypothetical protein BU24DRAFT_17123 [Aaosphaeria arxii CBS 175.79]
MTEILIIVLFSLPLGMTAFRDGLLVIFSSRVSLPGACCRTVRCGAVRRVGVRDFTVPFDCASDIQILGEKCAVLCCGAAYVCVRMIRSACLLEEHVFRPSIDKELTFSFFSGQRSFWRWRVGGGLFGRYINGYATCGEG